MAGLMTREWKDAVHRGAIDEMQRLLAAGSDIDARDSHGQTALMLAAAEGRGHLVEFLIERGAVLDRTAKVRPERFDAGRGARSRRCRPRID